ncbi:membrane protein insertion efficiency factor YidD [bacterium]|nr:membrane protein insertion efficiency factor YidD [bacterium]
MVQLSISAIKVYQAIAPSRIRNSCRFHPTCSEYAIESLKKYGFIKGWTSTIHRLRRCKPPFGGIDNP